MAKPMIKPEDFKLQESLGKIKHVLIVISGKGGVGKSTVSSNLALALAERGNSVGLMDIDITGPNIAKMFGVEDVVLDVENDKLVPVKYGKSLKLMSMAFLLPDRDSPVLWRGPIKMGAIRQFIEDVNWGEIDYLVVDMPPGTGDEALSIVQLIPEADGMVVVTTPQDVAVLDARKTINFSRQAEIPLLGLIENMSGFVCPHCGETTDIFGKGGGKRAAGELGVDFLGSVPIDGEVSVSSDRGRPIIEAKPDSPTSKAFLDIAGKIAARVK
ncbi:MAG: Mrp/NBP35 family ATP-binding protein [Thermoplasmatales archaeon]|nr:Mrp/NBP35 family ATP-binding protein [Thermoplasmatales archaeon]